MSEPSPWWTPALHADRRPFLLARNRIATRLRQWFAERDFFEVDAKFIVVAALAALAKEGKLDTAIVTKAITDLGVNPEKPNPAVS